MKAASMLRLWIAASAVLLSSCGDGPSQVRTPPGEPVGAASSLTVGPAGGEVVSSDGRLRVRFPEGALAADTEVRIQPITNATPSGRGLAYRLEPHGLSFGAPVELVFSYGDDDLEGTAPEALVVATQDEAGSWWLPGPVALDTSARTVTVRAPHFSDWSMLAGWQLEAPDTVKVGKQASVRVVFCADPPDLTSLLLALYACRPADVDLLDAVDGWAVNGVDGGNASVGTVSPTSAFAAQLTAPAQVPDGNPVAVSAKVLSSIDHAMLVTHVRVIQEDCGTRGGRSVPCTFSGDTSYEATQPAAGSSIHVTAHSTWRFDHWDPNQENVALYVPVAGSVQVVSHTFFDCTVDDSPSTHSIGTSEDPRVFALDFGTDPPTLRTVRATSVWPVIETLGGGPECLTPGTIEENGTFSWVESGDVTSRLTASGLLSGTYTPDLGSTGTLTSSWSFAAE